MSTRDDALLLMGEVELAELRELEATIHKILRKQAVPWLIMCEPPLRLAVVPTDGATDAQHRHARRLTAYLNTPEVAARIQREADANVLNAALYGDDPKGWPS